MATTQGPQVIKNLQAAEAVNDTAQAANNTAQTANNTAQAANNTAQTAAGAITAYAVDGALAATTGHAALTKAGVGAYTLAAPAADGIVKRIINRTANAHVVTATGLVDDGVIGGSKNTMTFAAFAGACIELLSYGGKWNVIAKNLVTIA